MKISIKSILCLTLVLLMLMPYGTVIAQNIEIEETEDFVFSELLLSDVPKQLAEIIKKDNVASLDNGDIFELNKVTVANDDGTKTSYMFNEPIKYYDNDKKVKFIDNSFKKSTKWNKLFLTYEYENSSNDKKLYMPKHIKNGILYVDGDFSLELIPNAKKNSKAVQRDFVFANKDYSVVEYADVFAKGYHLQYMALNDGFKENIFVEEYTGVNTFTFQLNIPGYRAELGDGGVTVKIYSKESEEPIYVMNQPYVQDSYVGDFDGYDHFGFKNYYELEYVSDGKYNVIMVIDNEYLSDPRTVYPVLIDPSTALASSGSIEDTYVCQNNNANHSEESVLRLGYDATDGKMSIFVRNNFMWYFRYIRPENIISAKYCTEKLGNTTNAMGITIHEGLGGVAPSSATYENLQQSKGELVSSFIWNPSTVEPWNFDITSVVKRWLKLYLGESGTYESHGFIIDTTSDANGYVNLRSANNASGDIPCFYITYNEDISLPTGDYFIKNMDTNQFLASAETSGNAAFTQNYRSGDSDQRWYIYNAGNGLYTIQLCTNTNYYLQPRGGQTADNTAIEVNGQAPAGNYPYYTWWRIVQNENGSYRFMPYVTTLGALSMEYLGNKALLFDYRGYADQTWEVLGVPTSIEIIGTSVQVNTTTTLVAKIEPKNAIRDVVWSIKEGADLATINQDGDLYAYKRGVVTVVATTLYGIYYEKEIVIIPAYQPRTIKPYNPNYTYNVSMSEYYARLSSEGAEENNETIFLLKKEDFQMLDYLVNLVINEMSKEEVRTTKEVITGQLGSLAANMLSKIPGVNEILLMFDLLEFTEMRDSESVRFSWNEVCDGLVDLDNDEFFEIRVLNRHNAQNSNRPFIEMCLVTGEGVGDPFCPIDAYKKEIPAALFNYEQKAIIADLLYRAALSCARSVKTYTVWYQATYGIGKGGW